LATSEYQQLRSTGASITSKERELGRIQEKISFVEAQRQRRQNEGKRDAATYRMDDLQSLQKRYSEASQEYQNLREGLGADTFSAARQAAPKRYREERLQERNYDPGGEGPGKSESRSYFQAKELASKQAGIYQYKTGGAFISTSGDGSFVNQQGEYIEIRSPIGQNNDGSFVYKPKNERRGTGIVLDEGGREALSTGAQSGSFATAGALFTGVIAQSNSQQSKENNFSRLASFAPASASVSFSGSAFKNTWSSGESYIKNASINNIPGTGRRLLTSFADAAGRTGLGDVFPSLRTSSPNKTRAISFFGRRVDTNIAVGSFVPKGISFVGTVSEPQFARVAEFSDFTSRIGTRLRSSSPVGQNNDGSLIYKEATAFNKLAGGTVSYFSQGSANTFGYLEGASRKAADKPLQVIAETGASYFGGKVLAIGAQKFLVNPLARRAASKYATGGVEGFNAALRSSRRSQAALGAIGLGSLFVTEAGKTPQQLGADSFMIIPGAFGAASGIRSATGLKTSSRIIGEPTIKITKLSGSGLRTRLSAYRSESVQVNYEAFGGFRKPGIRSTEVLSRVTFANIGGRANGETIPASFRLFTTPSKVAGSRVDGFSSYKGRFNVVSDRFEFFKTGRGSSGREFFRTSFSSRDEGLVSNVISTTDIFSVRGGRGSYRGSQLSRAKINYEDVGSFYRGVGTETRPLEFRSRVADINFKSPRSSRGPIGRRGQIAIPSSDSRFGNGFRDFTGLGETYPIDTTPPISNTRLNPFASSGPRGPRVSLPSFGISSPRVMSSSIPLSFASAYNIPSYLSSSGILAGSRSLSGSSSTPSSRSISLSFYGASVIPGVVSSSYTDVGVGSSTRIMSTPFGGSSSISVPSPRPPVETPPFIGIGGPFGVPLFGPPGKGSGGGRGRGRAFKYAPSLNALIFNIKGKKENKRLTGFETRPILAR